MIAALRATPGSETYEHWFQKRRPYLEEMAETSDPGHHKIEEQEVQTMAGLCAIEKLDVLSEEVYSLLTSPEEFHERLMQIQKQIQQEVMTLWNSGSETLREWGIAYVEPPLAFRLADRVIKWEHRAIRARIAGAITRHGIAALDPVIEQLKGLSAQEPPEGSRQGQTRVWVTKDGYSLDSSGSGLFQESLFEVIVTLGTLMGGGSDPVQFCLEQVLHELICEGQPVRDPSITNLSDNQRYRYLTTAYTGGSRIPTDGFIDRLCETLQWYCRRLLGILNRQMDSSLRARPADSVPLQSPNPESPSAREWNELTITFLSEERVGIDLKGSERETRNYEEMGFADRRGGKPALAWVALRDLSGSPEGLFIGKKRAKEIRSTLQKRYSITADPLPYRKQLGYVPRFALGRSSAYDS
ncbi:MAG: hypothetical protein ABI824_16655 [Acidobacteriota bacterium]